MLVPAFVRVLDWLLKQLAVNSGLRLHGIRQKMGVMRVVFVFVCLFNLVHQSCANRDLLPKTLKEKSFLNDLFMFSFLRMK